MRLCGLLLLLVLIVPARAQIRADEKIVFYPTYGWLNDSGTTWTLEIHASVFEPEPDSIWRNRLINEFTARTGLQHLSTSQSLALDKNLRLFMVDNERGKRLRVKLAGRELAIGPTAENGHATLIADFAASQFKDAVTTRPAWVTFSAVLPQEFEGRVQLIPPVGVSVISDIDDTIKQTDVLDRNRMLANTFILPAKPIAGMAALYRAWADSGAAFHYISGSPWQLHGPLAEFMLAEGFPAGSMHMRFFRIKDSSLIDFVSGDISAHKRERIETLLERFPRRMFILIGDSGERDPEIYGDIARRFPERIKSICVRRVAGSDLSSERLARAFEGVANDKVKLFGDPTECMP